MTLGLTNGTNNYGLSGWGGDSFTVVKTAIYGTPYGSTGGGSANHDLSLGVTTDPTKSGLIATFSGLTLGTVPSEKLGGFYIRY